METTANINEETECLSKDRQNNISKIQTLWRNNSYFPTLVLILICIGLTGYSLFGSTVDILSNPLFKLCVLFVSAKICGWIVSLIKLPPMVGMLFLGVILRNVGYIEISGNYQKFTSVLRQLALVNIMLPAGLGLDPQTLKKMKWNVLNLSIVPVAGEVIGVTIASHYFLDLPWLWGLLLGLLLAAVSPAVIIPCLFELQDLGYGVNKGIDTLVIAAATLNDIICIALFGIVIGTIFNTGSLLSQLSQGPIVITLGFTFGVFFGYICRYLPHKHEEHLVTLRTLLLGFGCVLSAIGSNAIGYGGAGSLGCLIAAFVASCGWRQEGWGNKNPVRINFNILWKFFEPISFSLIGIEVNFKILDLNIVLWSLISMIIPLLLRIIISYVVMQKSNLNKKENLFVALSWVPKATVQAALGPVALDIARNLNLDSMVLYSNTIVIAAVLSIIITSPIGAIFIMQLGPRFLHKTSTVFEEPNNKSQVTNDISDV